LLLQENRERISEVDRQRAGAQEPGPGVTPFSSRAAHRHAVELWLDGHTTAEIAAELGLSGVAVRVALTRLRQQMRASGVFGDWL
jgi:hypothetical protein